MQASSHNSQGIVDDRVNGAGVSTVALAGAQYSAVEWTRAKVAIDTIVAPAPELETASLLKSVTHGVNFL